MNKREELEKGEKLLREARKLTISTPPEVTTAWKRKLMCSIRREAMAHDRPNEVGEERMIWCLVSSVCALAVLLVIGFFLYQTELIDKTYDEEKIISDIENSVFADLNTYAYQEIEKDKI